MKHIIVAICFILNICLSSSVGAQPLLNIERKPVSVYVCSKTTEKITIDGKLSENIWKKANKIVLKEMAKGTEPEYRSAVILLWDNRYLYIGGEIEDADVWVRATLKDSECPAEYVERVNIHRYMKDTQWHRLECDIMTFDNFVKFFLDPDADGKNYLEFHINAANNVFDAWYQEGLVKPGQIYLESPHVSWKCPGLLSATFIDGTINASNDIDRGWSFEIAIPWSSIREFIKENCPPESDDIWGLHIGRVHRDYSWSNERFYWTWPVIGDYISHNPALYGKLVFSEKLVNLKLEPSVKKQVQERKLTLFVSGGGESDEIIPEVKKIGACAFWCSAYPLESLKKFIKAGKKYSIDIYGTLSLADIDLWKAKKHGINPPLQKMNTEEMKVYEMLKDRNTRFATDYQWGEEPKGKKTEVLIHALLCFHDEKVKDFFKEQINEVLQIDGLKGIGFDFFGYQNYRCCMCDVSEELFQKYLKEHSEMTVEKAREQFSLETLISFYNELSDYARSIKPDIKIITHIYPVFLPEPFYGNRLDIDYCCQTVAWFFPWNLARVARYTKTIVSIDKKYYKRNNGVAMIGFYHDREFFPTKQPERIEKELETIVKNGCFYILVHNINDVLKNQEVKKIFSKYFRESR